MEIDELIQTLLHTGALPATDARMQQLSQAVAYLIEHDFERLVRLLYTIDVDERVLKHLLHQQQGRSAADIIAELILERQLQKKALREQAKTDTNTTDEERW